MPGADAQSARAHAQALLENLLVCGGGSGAPGSAVRLLGEVCALAPPSTAPGLAPVPEYMPGHTLRAAAWMGGAVLSKVCMAHRRPVMCCAREGCTYDCDANDHESIACKR